MRLQGRLQPWATTTTPMSEPISSVCVIDFTARWGEFLTAGTGLIQLAKSDEARV